MWRRALSGLERLLYKVIKPQITDREGATDRQMKEKWNINTRSDANLWCEHPRVLLLPPAFARCVRDHGSADLWRGITIKLFLTKSSVYFSYLLLTHSEFTHKETHCLSSSLVSLKSGCPMKFGWKWVNSQITTVISMVTGSQASLSFHVHTVMPDSVKYLTSISSFLSREAEINRDKSQVGLKWSYLILFVVP